MKIYLYIALIIILFSLSCSKDHYELHEVDLNGIILPGKTDAETETRIKYIWVGGGCLRSIGETIIDRQNNIFTITPLGKELVGKDVMCPCDIFYAVEKATLGILSPGKYYVEVIGTNTTFRDSLDVPDSAPDSLFQFRISAVEIETDQPVADIELDIYFWELDTILVAVTDSTGIATMSYHYLDVETLRYDLNTPYNYWWISADAVLGQPENITIKIENE